MRCGVAQQVCVVWCVCVEWLNRCVWCVCVCVVCVWSGSAGVEWPQMRCGVAQQVCVVCVVCGVAQQVCVCGVAQQVCVVCVCMCGGHSGGTRRGTTPQWQSLLGFGLLEPLHHTQSH